MTLSKVIAVIIVVSIFQETISQNCLCTREYSPICASDGKTYSNVCLFKCEKQRNRDLKIQLQGECDVVDKMQPVDGSYCICTMELRPVCASDNKTYSNKCSLECEQRKRRELKLIYEGECVKDLPISNEVIEMDSVVNQCTCTLIYMPVCGSDNQTYDSECDLGCAKLRNTQLKLKHQGNCVNI